MALSSTSSSQTPISTARYPSDRCGNDTCYFPNCRKDANCICEICIESFNATKDLHSALRFPPKKTKKSINNTSPPSTPEPVSSISNSIEFPPSILVAKSKPKERLKRKEKGKSFRFVGYFASLVFVAYLVGLGVNSGVVERFGGPKLELEAVRGFGEEISVLERGLKWKLGTIERKIVGLVGNGVDNNGGVCNCSTLDAAWKLNQDEGNRLLFQWRCVIYKSVAEELSVWGSPLQTSGIIMAGISSRSLTLLSGRINEWSKGKLVPVSRTSNGSSWTLEKLCSAAVQLEKETWVLEYKRNALFDSPGLTQYIWEILNERIQGFVKKLKLRLMFSIIFGRSSYRILRDHKQFKAPT